MQHTEISLDVTDGIATLTLDRPDQLNAYTPQMGAELIDAFDQTDADDDVRVVVVTGRGRGFCAGVDLAGGSQELAGRTDERQARGRFRDGGGVVALRIFRSLKPIIAAINGPAVGFGITLTLPMDIRLIADNAKVGFVFNRRALTPEACSTYFLPRLVGVSRAAEWCYTGRIFGPEEALAGGLVRSVHAPDELLPAAYALARDIADNASPVSVSLTRQMLWRMLGASHPMEAHRAETMSIAERIRSADFAEGVQSFFAKRPPQFPMRVNDGLPEIFPDWNEPAFS